MKATLRQASRSRLFLGLLWKAAIILFGGVGLLLNLENAGGFMDGSYLFLYFTILSNIAMMASSFFFLVIDVAALETGRESSLPFFRLFRLSSASSVSPPPSGSPLRCPSSLPSFSQAPAPDTSKA